MRRASFAATIGVTAALLPAVLFGGALAAYAADEPLPKPAWVKAYDSPNDDGLKISVEWAKAEGERGTAWYELSMAPAEAGPYELIMRQPTDVAPSPEGLGPSWQWKEEDTQVFGPFGHEAVPTHHLAYSPLAVYDPGALIEALLEKEEKGEARDKAAATLKRFEDLFGRETVEKARQVLADSKVDDPADLEQAEHVAAEVNEKISDLLMDRPYFFKLEVSEGERRERVDKVVSAQGKDDWFNWKKLNNFVFAVLFCGVVLGFIRLARRNPNLYLRRIGGLEAVDEALGRATEMGKPVLFAHGLLDMDSVSTIAAVNILGEITKRVAKFDTKLIAVCNLPVVWAISQETVKEAYLHAGRPDAYSPDDVVMVAGEQFSYVAAVSGIMMRQKPAANFFMGYFYAESLLLAETGAATGAIQIAGTDAYTQLPFFVTTCDYTLMGEELYAASAYLSRDPLLLGSLKGQDAGKALLMVLLLIGTLLATLAVVLKAPALDRILKIVFQAYT